VLRRGLSARRGLALVMVFGVPVLFLWDVTLDAFNVPKLALITLGVAFAASLWLLEMASGAARSRPALLLPAAAILVPTLVSWLATDYKGWSLWGEYQRYEGLVPTLLVVGAGLLVADVFRGRLRLLTSALTLSAALVALYAIAQSMGADPFNVPVTEYAPSSIGQSNFVGGFLAICLPLALALWTSGKGGGRTGAMAATIVIVLAIGLTFSQGGWAAAAAGVAVFAGFSVARKKPKARMAGAAVAALIAAGSVGLVVAGMVTSASSPIPDTARARGLWWISAVRMGLESPIWGSGPNVYAVEGAHYRVLEDNLAHGTAIADSPHSVPLSQFANAGVLGLAGFAVITVWAVRTASAVRPEDSVGAGVAAGLAAYFVQSLVSLDSLVLGFTLWVLLGALASTRDADAPLADRPRPSWAKTAFVGAGVVLALGAAYWTTRFVAADMHADRAIDSFNDREHDAGLVELRRALETRDDFHYRSLLGNHLGQAALREKQNGRRFVDEMRQEFEYLADFPSVRSLSVYADALHQWSIYDTELETEALNLFERAHELDDDSPDLAISRAETLVRLGRPDEAINVLEPLVERIETDFPEYRFRWPGVPAVLAIAAEAAGDEATASASLERARTWSPEQRNQDCHVLMATHAVEGEGRPLDQEELLDASPNLLFCSPATLELLK
jgi:tetratricopeptide (TPR) repeat protein